MKQSNHFIPWEAAALSMSEGTKGRTRKGHVGLAAYKAIYVYAPHADGDCLCRGAKLHSTKTVYHTIHTMKYQTSLGFFSEYLL